MNLKFVYFLMSATVALQAQTPPPTPKPSPDIVAGIPVNYDEAKAGSYVLPEAQQWKTRARRANLVFQTPSRNRRDVRDPAVWSSAGQACGREL